jgi:hypothetical protein
MKGAALEDIADLPGRKSLAMTRRYARLRPNKLHVVVSLLGATATTTAASETALRRLPRKLLCSKLCSKSLGA